MRSIRIRAAVFCLAVMSVLALTLFAGSLISLPGRAQGRAADGMRVVEGRASDIGTSETVRGTVVHSVTKKPIANAQIELKNINLGVGYYVVRTDSKGTFTVTDFMPSISYRIAVSADGFVSWNSFYNYSAEPLKISLNPESVIQGAVTDSAGKPVAGVDVRIRSSYGYYDYDDDSRAADNRIRPIETGADGSYRFAKLPSGAYSLTFSKAGYIAETVSVQSVKTGETFSLPMKLFRPAVLTGRLTVRELNVPARNIDVYLEGKWNHGTSSLDDGSYRIDDLKPGTYSMKVRHPGFEEAGRAEVTIAEGATVSAMDYALSPKSPGVDISASRYTFTPGSTVGFELRAFRAETVGVTLYAVPEAYLLSDDRHPDSIDPVKAGFRQLEQWKEPVKDFTPYEWRYQTLEVKRTLPVGAYCVEVKGEGSSRSRRLFTVSSIGAVVKRSPSSVTVYVSNLITNAPASGVRVGLYDAPERDDERDQVENLQRRAIASGTTAANGIAQFARAQESRFAVLVTAPDGSYAVCMSGGAEAFARESEKFYIYTDRPVYRAGDTVHAKVVAKRRGSVLEPIAGVSVHYRVKNQYNGRIAAEGDAVLDAWGTFATSVRIEPNLGLGQYVLECATRKDTQWRYTASGRFYVEQYRKPEFRVEVSPLKEFCLNGDRVEFRVEAKYFFGASVKNATLRYRFYEKRADFASGSYDDEERSSWSRLRLEGEKALDAGGVAVLSLDAGVLPHDREISLEVSVIDASNVSISASGRVRVGRGEYYVTIRPEKNFYTADERKRVRIETRTQAGKPVSAKLELALYRYAWKPYQRLHVRAARPEQVLAVTTDASGRATAEFPGSAGAEGEFDIAAKGIDRHGNEITASKVIFVYGQGSDVPARIGNLELEVEKTEMSGSGDLTLLLKSRFTDAWVCLTVEGRDVHAFQVIPMKANVVPVKLPVKDSWAPNFFVTATMQRGRALYTVSRMVSLPGRNTRMNLVVKNDKETYGPGDTARISVTATDEAGKPVQADLSLAAVDESIYSIRSDHTTPISDFFYAKISNWVSTTYSYPITLFAGAGKDAAPKVRTRFEDTAFWKSDIRTGADGTAAVSFTVPDNLTEWRLTARGHDRTGLVGETRARFMVTRDIVARIGRPRFFTAGDSVDLIGIATSNTTRGLPSVALRLNADGAPLAPRDAKTISLPPYGTHAVKYPFAPAKSGNVRLGIEADAGVDARDAMTVAVPVQERGSAYELFGIVEPGKKASLPFLKGSDEFTFVPERAEIVLHPSPLYQLFSGARYTFGYPYGCVEQTVNRFLPLLAIRTMLDKGGAPQLYAQEKLPELDDAVKTGITRLAAAQNDDGSWGWFGGDRGNEFLTGYVMYGARQAALAGYAVPTALTSRGVAAVRRMLSVESRRGGVSGYDELAWLLFVYALYGEWDQDAFADISKNAQTDYALAFAARSLSVKNTARDRALSAAGMDRARMIASMHDRVIARMKRDEYGAYWDSGAVSWGWQGGRSEVSAHVLASLIESGRKDSLPAQIATSLAARQRGGFWISTKETASVVLALAAYFEGADLRPSSGSVAVKLNTTALGTIAYDDTRREDAYNALRRTADLRDTRIGAPLELSVEGSAGKGATVSAVISGTMRYSPGIIASLAGSEKRSLASLSNGISVNRSFYSLKRVYDANGAEFLIPEQIGDTVKSGDEIMVKLRVSSATETGFLAIEDYLPAGFEVTRTDAYGGGYSYVHSERWDNRMVYFVKSLAPGRVYEISYTMRAELTGSFFAPPTRAWCMYEPSLQGWSAPVEMKVR